MDCPHCYRRVIPLKDGICPSCHCDTRTPPKGEENRVVVIVAETSAIPETCCGCGLWTRRKVRVTSSRQQGGRDAFRYHEDDGDRVARFISVLAFGRIFTNLFSLFAANSAPGGARSLTVCVPMPYCCDCSKAKRHEPVVVDYDYCVMRFAVCQKFAGEFQELNPAAKK